jgi:hypothetical protein
MIQGWGIFDLKARGTTCFNPGKTHRFDPNPQKHALFSKVRSTLYTRALKRARAFTLRSRLLEDTLSKV